MKKIFTLFTLLISAITLLNATSYVVGPTTNTGTNDVASWNFNDGFSISNTGGKGYSTGTVDGVSYMKFSRNVAFTMNMPDGFTCNSIEITGYDNYADVEAYLYEINGDTLEATTYPFPVKDGSGVPTIKTHTFNLKNPATGSFIFQFKGQQTVVIFTLSNVTTSLNNPVVNNKLNMDEIVDVYSIDGRLVRNQIRCGQAMTELNNGIYLINNQKMVINHLR